MLQIMAMASRLLGIHWGFILGPRINAAGRMETAGKVVELLTGESYDKIIPIAKELDDHNHQRREVENRIREQAIAAIEKNDDHKKKKGLVVGHEGWHGGLLGLSHHEFLNGIIALCLY